NTIPSNLSANVTNPFQIANFTELQQTNPLVYQNMQTLGFFTSPTIARSQLLMPYPQMTGLTNGTSSIGVARTHSLLVTFQRRFSKGFHVNVGYTRLKD